MQNYVTDGDYETVSCYGDLKTPLNGIFSVFLEKMKVRFDNEKHLCYDCVHKSCDEDTRLRKDSQRGLRLVQEACETAADDTTSELRVRKCHAGCAR